MALPKVQTKLGHYEPFQEPSLEFSRSLGSAAMQTFPGQETPRNPCNIYCMPSMPLHGKRKTVCFGLKRFVTLLRTDTTQLYVYIYAIYVGCYMLYM